MSVRARTAGCIVGCGAGRRLAVTAADASLDAVLARASLFATLEICQSGTIQIQKPDIETKRHGAWRCGDSKVDQLLTLTFLLLHCTQPERVFLCAFRGAACMVIDSKTRTFVTDRESDTHVG